MLVSMKGETYGVHAPQRQGSEEDEAMVNQRNNHEHDNRNEKQAAGADLIAPFVCCHDPTSSLSRPLFQGLLTSPKTRRGDAVFFPFF